jgi:NADH-quinone oxidoreductase subunit K
MHSDALAPLYQGNLLLAALVFAIGAFGFLWKTNAIGIFLCIELMLNAANLAFVTLAQSMGKPEGIAAFIFVITIAAAESGIGLALFIKIFNEKETIDADSMAMLHD